jgi:hypothetical protein
LTKDQAQETLRLIGCSGVVIPDFHKLSSEQVEQVLIEAALMKYRTPKNANGSRARYFYTYLARAARKES